VNRIAVAVVIAVGVVSCVAQPCDDDGICRQVEVDAGSAGAFDQVAMYAGGLGSFTSTTAMPPATPETAGMPAPAQFKVAVLSMLSVLDQESPPTSTVNEPAGDDFDGDFAAAAVGWRDGAVIGTGVASATRVPSDESIARATVMLAPGITYELYGTRVPQCLRLVEPDATYYFIYGDGC
jgi:hypothetical protein